MLKHQLHSNVSTSSSLARLPASSRCIHTSISMQRKNSTFCRAQHAREGSLQAQGNVEDMLSTAGINSRRAVLALGMGMLSVVPIKEARADAVQDLVRRFVRPEDEYTPTEAVVVLMDARSTLREIKALASTPEDSEERFKARSQWPGFATRLRPAGPATPIVASLASGGDREETIGQMYGGKAGEPGMTDKVYLSLGKVLTISGRTIRKEAQASPEAAAEAKAAIDDFLKAVPQAILDEAQAFRVQRAKDLGSSYSNPLARLK